MRNSALLALLLAPALAAAAPLDMAHSGRLLDSAGAPLQGPHDLRLTLYDAVEDPFWTHLYEDLPVEDGFFSVVLAGVPSAQLLADVQLGVQIDGAAELAPRTALISVPRAHAADVAARIPTAPTGASGSCPAEGALIWDRAAQAVKVCDDTLQWAFVTKNTVIESGGVRRWSDGSAALSCDDYRHPTSGSYLYLGTIGDGVYAIDPDGAGPGDPFSAYCDMSFDGGGWTLLFNLDSGDGANHHWEDTTWWLGAGTEGSPGLSSGHKSPAFSTLTGWDEVLIRVHNGGASTWGTAIRPLLPAYAGQSLRGILNSGNDVVFTGTASAIAGGVPTTFNSARTQTLHGDIFVEFNHALKANSTSGWGAEENLTRLATTLTNNDYGHTYTGLGGRHQHGIGSYGTKYESAPISPYCELRNGYGTDSNASSFHSSYPYSGSCRNGGFSWIAADTALYVR
jgi:hypothetical protein